MTYMGYIIKNISVVINKHLGIFLLVFLSEIITVISLFFSFGLFCNTQETVGQLEEDYYVYWYSPSMTDGGSQGIKGKFKELAEYLGEDFNFANIYLIFQVKDGESLGASTYIHDSDLKYLESYEEPVFYLANEMEGLLKNERITLDGKQYAAVVTKDSAKNMVEPVTIPIQRVSDDFNCRMFMLTTKNRPTKQDIDDLNDKCFDLFGAVCNRAPEPVNLMELQINNSFYLYTFLIVILVTLNLSVFFRYIFSLRTKLIRIFIISGARSSDVLAIFTGEGVLSMAVAYVVAYTLFTKVLLGLCIKVYPHFASYYSTEFYLKTFLMYIALSVIMLVIIYTPFIRRNIKNERSV